MFPYYSTFVLPEQPSYLEMWSTIQESWKDNSTKEMLYVPWVMKALDSGQVT